MSFQLLEQIFFQNQLEYDKIKRFYRINFFWLILRKKNSIKIYDLYSNYDSFKK